MRQPSVEASPLQSWSPRTTAPGATGCRYLTVWFGRTPMRRRGATETISFGIRHEPIADAFHPAWRWAMLLHGLGSARYLGKDGRLSAPCARRSRVVAAKSTGGHFWSLGRARRHDPAQFGSLAP